MIKIKASFNGFEQSLESLVSKVGQGVEQGIEEVGIKVYEAYDRNMPTDSGETLANSYREVFSDNSSLENAVKVGNRSPIATYLEFGTGLVGEGTYKGDLPSWVTYRQTPWKYYHREYGEVKTSGQVAKQPLTNALEEIKPNISEIIASNIGGTLQ